MKNALIISSSDNLALFEKILKKSFNVVSVKDRASGEAVAKEMNFDIVISDDDIEPSFFPFSDVITTAEKDGAYFLSEIDEKMLSALIGWIDFSSRKTEQIKIKNSELQKKIEDISIVSRAKFVLMKTLGMTENEAHKYIEKNAMEMRISKCEIAKRLLATYDN